MKITSLNFIRKIESNPHYHDDLCQSEMGCKSCIESNGCCIAHWPEDPWPMTIKSKCNCGTEIFFCSSITYCKECGALAFISDSQRYDEILFKPARIERAR